MTNPSVPTAVAGAGFPVPVVEPVVPVLDASASPPEGFGEPVEGAPEDPGV